MIGHDRRCCVGDHNSYVATDVTATQRTAAVTSNSPKTYIIIRHARKQVQFKFRTKIEHFVRPDPASSPET